jgi:hypothetical protein
MTIGRLRLQVDLSGVYLWAPGWLFFILGSGRKWVDGGYRGNFDAGPKKRMRPSRQFCSLHRGNIRLEGL